MTTDNKPTVTVYRKPDYDRFDRVVVTGIVGLLIAVLVAIVVHFIRQTT